MQKLNGGKMAHRRRERVRGEEELQPNVKTIIATIERDISSRKPPSEREIVEYIRTALAKKTEELRESISKEAYARGLDAAKDLAGLLDKGDPKALNRWG
jgi:MoxR-like ATPase